MSDVVNLLDSDAQSLLAYCENLGERSLRARQLQCRIHQSGTSDSDEMTDPAKPLCKKLATRVDIQAPAVITDHLSSDGMHKWLVDVGQDNVIETVYVSEEVRGVLCVSFQAEYAVNRRPCSTGKQGFLRSLSTNGTTGQLWMAGFVMRKQLGRSPKGDRVIANMVIMGMGEPLPNYDAVVSTFTLMLDGNAYGLSHRRVTVSTFGAVSMMDRLTYDVPVALAVPLHTSSDTLCDVFVPLNRKYSLAELMAAYYRYLEFAPRDFTTSEYCILDGVNDTVKYTRELLRVMADVSCKFNLIPFNPFPKSGLRHLNNEQTRCFSQILLDAGIVITIRKTRGDSIDATCSQLVGEIKDRIHLAERGKFGKIIKISVVGADSTRRMGTAWSVGRPSSVWSLC